MLKKAWNKIRNFFSASAPFFTYLLIRLCIAILEMILTLIIKMSNGSFDNDYDISHEMIFAGQVLMDVIGFIAFLSQMKFHSYKFSDISPVKQNAKVWAAGIFFGIGLCFILRFMNDLYCGLTGLSPDIDLTEFSSLAIILYFMLDLSTSFTQELISRGLLLQNFKKHFSLIFSVIIISIEFISFRDISAWAYAILYNILLFLIMFRFGDIRLCIVIRLAMNLTNSLITYLVTEPEKILNIGFIAGLAVSAVSMFIMIKFADALPEGKPDQA
ncbi:MAG: type II CAAX prenyl endopeptidase Rce1 family protein [Oscillospiraceae bacterium]